MYADDKIEFDRLLTRAKANLAEIDRLMANKLRFFLLFPVIDWKCQKLLKENNKLIAQAEELALRNNN